MKGVSTVIATLLMLIITIALAGLAYSYISGLFTTKTGVILSIGDTSCASNGGAITVYVKNDGTVTSGPVNVTATGACAASVTCATLITSIAGGAEASTTCTRTTPPATGYCTIRATTTGSSASGQVYCPS